MLLHGKFYYEIALNNLFLKLDFVIAVCIMRLLIQLRAIHWNQHYHFFILQDSPKGIFLPQAGVCLLVPKD